MKISYAITVCNEETEITQLLDFLFQNIRIEDEICVLLDKPKATENIIELLNSYEGIITFKESAFPGDFSQWKNELTEMCSGDYIFQIDADEIPHENLVYALPFLLEKNPIDVMLVPRVNTVEGLTQEHIRKWGWNVDKLGWVNWPDYQWRIYRNTPEIRWKNKVHEVLDGYKTLSYIPQDEEWCLYHHKNIERQERQNEFYNRI
jgi:glycosyltransferase involved in cell wall biosynthesis